jgi:NitT/TauT family transport system substrate-binding protein
MMMSGHFRALPPRLRASALCALALVLLAACAQPAPSANRPAGSAPAPAAQAPGGAPAARPASLEQVTIYLDWIGSSHRHLGYWLAKERGWYAEQGLDVAIESGRGSGQVAQLVTAGKAEFGQMLPIVVVESVAKGAPLKVVAMVHQRSTQSLRFLDSSGIRTPKDLEGKTVGLVPGSVQQLFWPAFAATTGIDVNKVDVVNVDQQTYLRTFVEGRLAAANSDLDGAENVRVKRETGGFGQFAYGDYLPMLGQSVVTTDKMIKERPQVVRGFVKATQRAWEYLYNSPREAVAEASEIVARNVENVAAEDVLDNALSIPPDIMRAKGHENEPLGWSSPDDWSRMLAIQVQYTSLPRTPTLDELTTNDFVR